MSEIRQAHKVLFVLFTRYGDTIIDLVVIREFVEQYPDKEYLILCPRQMQPYVYSLLPNIKCITLNKRNLFDMLKVDSQLKKWQPDIGFSPWSNGFDSCYFLTYCEKYLCYKDFSRPKVINHYEVVRSYLILPSKPWKVERMALGKEYNNVVVCPQSTDVDRSINQGRLNEIIADTQRDYPHSKITIAAMDGNYFREGHDQFLFKKTAESSQKFINLIKRSDLVIASDSGPLHIAGAFNKDVVAEFYSTEPEVVLNTGTKILHE